MGWINEDQQDQDIRDVFAEERSRGSKRGPLAADQRRKQRQLRQEALKALREKDERWFTALLRRAGIRDESPAFAAAP